MQRVFSGEISLDAEIKVFIREHLTYRYLFVPDEPTARALEKFGIKYTREHGISLLNEG